MGWLNAVDPPMTSQTSRGRDQTKRRRRRRKAKRNVIGPTPFLRGDLSAGKTMIVV